MEPKVGLLCVFLLFVNVNGVFSEILPGNPRQTATADVDGMETLFARMAQMEAMVSKQQVELAEVRNELRATKAQLEDTRTETSEEIANLRKEFGAKMADIEKEHQKEVDTLKAKIELFEAAEAAGKEWNERYETDEDAIAVAGESEVEGHGSNLKSAIGKTFKRHTRESPVQKARRQENVPRAAFFAKLSNNTNHLGYNQPIVFDNVTTNIGNNYDQHVGMFRAPVAGVYLFSTSISSYSSSSGHFGFFINDGRETWFYNNGNENGWDESSQTIVVQLDKGDDVTVRSLEADHSVTGYDFSVFSGVLLFEDNPESIVIGK